MPRCVSVTKHITFDAAHYLLNPKWSKKKNMQTFHKCCLYKDDGQEEPHGHTYHVEVTVEGSVDPNTGYVIDFKELKKVLTEKTERMDHRLLNNIPELKDQLCTVENILYYFWGVIQDKIESIRDGVELTQIRMWETPDSYATLTKYQHDIAIFPQ